MTSDFVGTDMSGARFNDVSFAGAVFREADLSGVRMLGVTLAGADIEAHIAGLRVNGVEVEPLIEAELDRLNPGRELLRSTTPEGLLAGWAYLESLWGSTMDRAKALAPAELDRSVNEEWSFNQTLRHLIFVTDAWLGSAVLGEREFHPIALPAGFITEAQEYGVDPAADPSAAEVVAVRVDRQAKVKAFVASLSQDELDRVREPSPAPGWPPAKPRTALQCLHVIFNEEWLHHQFAVRDLAIVEGG
jgi:hypothetical protein